MAVSSETLLNISSKLSLETLSSAGAEAFSWAAGSEAGDDSEPASSKPNSLKSIDSVPSIEISVVSA